MSFSRASLTRKIIQYANASPASFPAHLVCHECLVRPSSCRIISSLAALPASSNGTTSTRHSTRFQSTSSFASTSHSSSNHAPHLESLTNTNANASNETAPARVSTHHHREESDVATGEPTVTSDAKPRTMPTIEDLEALKPRKMPMPGATDKIDSPDVAVYLRRFNSLASRVNRAFDKEQILHLARLLGIAGVHPKQSKKVVSLRFLTEHWGYIDQAGLEARSKARANALLSGVNEVEEGVPVTEAQTFLLLGRMDGQELLRKLTRKSKVKAYVRKVGDKSELVFVGAQEQVETAKIEWKKLQDEIKTVAVDTGLDAPLRQDQLKSLAIATDLHMAAHPRNARQVQVTHHSPIKTALARLQPLLTQLAFQAVIARAPRLAIVDGQHRTGLDSVPILSESLPWYMRGLPLTGCTRLTGSEGDKDDKVCVNVEMQRVSPEELERLVCDPLATMEGPLSVTAKFGHFLRVFSDPQVSAIGPAALDTWLGSADIAFLPSAPQGVLNRYSLPFRRYDTWQVEHHVADLASTSKNFRRLRYVSLSPHLPIKMICVERRVDRHNDRNPSSIEEPPATWTGTLGSYNYVNMVMPYNSVDARIEAMRTTPMGEEVQLQLTNIALNVAPPELVCDGRSYHLLDDQLVRQSRFESGLGGPLSDLLEEHEAVSEQIRDNRHRDSRSRTFQLQSKSSIVNPSSLLRAMQTFDR